jgi:acyl-CoA synthetase (AMP-forming)/AMP-acid ligase II
VVCSDRDCHDVLSQLQLVRRHRVTRVSATPAVLAAWAGSDGADTALQSLRCIVSSGAPLHWGVARSVLAAAPGARLLNLYGSTETAGDCCFADVGACCAAARGQLPGTVPIGRPLPRVTLQLLHPDSLLPLVDDTACGTGRLLVRGAVVAHGYCSGGGGGACTAVVPPARLLDLSNGGASGGGAAVPPQFVLCDDGTLAFLTGDLARWILIEVSRCLAGICPCDGCTRTSPLFPAWLPSGVILPACHQCCALPRRVNACCSMPAEPQLQQL